MFTQKSLITVLYLLFPLLIYSQDKAYKAGEIYTENIYQYGKMEVRMLAATGSGIISNFFTFKEGSELSSTFWEEIDIEVFGKDGANSWQSNLITGQGNSNLTRTEGVHQENGLGEAYHTYTIEWTPDSVTWLVDGIIMRQINDGQSLLINEETSLRFNIWNPNIPEWVGSFNEGILPVHMYVNWIKFYEWNGTSFSNSPTFEDDFNNFDDNTWTKANHTFAENMSDFISENVNTVNGYLVLSITNADETGYTGTPPTDGDENDTENENTNENDNTGDGSSINCNNIQTWNASTIYSQEGTLIVYNNNIYENKWYSKNQNPEAFSVNSWDLWTLIGSCDDNAAKSLDNDIFDLISFPNPFIHTINVIGNDSRQIIGSVKLVDLSGKTIAKSFANGNSKISINNINVAKGVYLLQIFNTKNQLIKVIKMVN